MRKKDAKRLPDGMLPERLEYTLNIEGQGQVELDLELQPRMQPPSAVIDNRGQRLRRNRKNVRFWNILLIYFFL